MNLINLWRTTKIFGKIAIIFFKNFNFIFSPTCQLGENNEIVALNSIYNDNDLLKWPHPQNVPLKRRQLSAKVSYLLTFREFKISMSSEEDVNIKRMSKNALLFGSDTLSPDLLATLWTIIAINMNHVLQVNIQLASLLFPILSF